MNSVDEQPQGFFNRGLVVILLTFSIPAILTIAGTYYVAVQGRVPGGEDSTICQQALTESTDVRLDVYAYTAGLVEFETQSILVRDTSATDTEWQTLFSDTMPSPETFTCDTNIQQVSETVFLLFNQKTIAISSDSGNTWRTHNICDDPRPQGNRCDSEALNYASIDIQADGTGELLVQESAVDEFGEPQRDESGNPIPSAEWTLLTDDVGVTWRLASSE
ncbi:MAG: hypothetical protein AAFN11_05940 [Chloroflexota bacterium]